MKHLTITIDGPAGSGKSTVAREVARTLGFTFLDTGALYRAAAVAIERAGSDVGDNEECGRVISHTRILLTGGSIEVDGTDVTEEIRSPRISELSSAIAVHPSVRSELVRIQRSFRGLSSLVAEGRDTGSVVFPDADIKIYLNASATERAMRRQKELLTKGTDLPLERVLNDMNRRDNRDSSRSASPLVIPEHAVVVDTTHLTFHEVVAKILSIVEEKSADK
ncbi:MAG: (d)CMP kinase [Syntrophaceae bacterium]|nr:(d)CMP kinase [Deltaproteobacteria bacterium]